MVLCARHGADRQRPHAHFERQVRVEAHARFGERGAEVDADTSAWRSVAFVRHEGSLLADRKDA